MKEPHHSIPRCLLLIGKYIVQERRYWLLRSLEARDMYSGMFNSSFIAISDEMDLASNRFGWFVHERLYMSAGMNRVRFKEGVKRVMKEIFPFFCRGGSA